MTIGANLPHIIDRVPKTVTPLHGVSQIDIIKGSLCFTDPLSNKIK